MNKNQNSVLLFHESITCRACGNKWIGYAHGFSRGHFVLTRNDSIAFISDDLGYAFPEHCPPKDIKNTSNFVDPLKALGWRDLECCPSCGSKDILANYDKANASEVACIEFNENDFENINSKWQLTKSGIEKSNQAN